MGALKIIFHYVSIKFIYMNVYKITNKINGKSYIGVTTNSIAHRWAQHCRLAKSGCQRALYRAIRKYGQENFIRECIDNTITSLDELYQKEQEYIKKYNTFDSIHGYNLTSGGNYFEMTADEKMKRAKRLLGTTLSPEIRAKISATKKATPYIPTDEYREKIRITSTGRKFSPESIEKRAAKLRGKKRTEEQKHKMRKAHLGKKFTNEHRHNISMALIGKRTKPFVMYKNGTYLGEFKTINEFCKIYNLNPVSTSRILLKKISSAKGYTGHRL